MKRFTIKFLLVLVPIHILILFYIFGIKKQISGDLGLLGMIPFGVDYYDNAFQSRQNIETNVEHFTCNSTSKYEVITLGDSFSKMEGDGYQTYLGRALNDTILDLDISIAKDMVSPEQIVVKLLKNGFFEQMGAKLVVFQSVERDFIERLSSVDFNKSLPADSMLYYYRYKEASKKTNNSFKDLFEASKKPVLEDMSAWIRMLSGYQNPIVRVELSKPFFTHKTKAEDLYFYKEDLKFNRFKNDTIDRAKQNFERIKEMFEAHDIKFIYFIPPTKYHAYQDYIVDNKLPRDGLVFNFEKHLSKDYFFYPLSIVDSMLQKGVKDVYKLNDSHWSYKASEQVGLELARRIKKMLKEEN